MPNFATVPSDIRLEIVCLAIAMSSAKNHWVECHNLSLVCRSLNETCGPIIFRNYHFDIRIPLWPTKKVYPPGTSISRWDDATIKLRLAHLRSKAPFVREITITDIGRNSPEGASVPEAFPPELMSDLLPLLHTLRGVTSVSLVGPMKSKTLLPIGLWNWLVQTSPRALDFSGKFEIDIPTGQNLEPIENVNRLSVNPYGIHFNPILETLHPNTLVVKYSTWQSLRLFVSSRDLALFKPTSNKLRSIFVEICSLFTTFDEPVLDPSAVPQSTIRVEIDFSVVYKMHVPSAWKSSKPKIQQIFVDDLSGFSVSRATNSTYAKILVT